METAITYNNELYHFGVLGMKWGIRHDRSGSSKRRKSKSTLSKEDKRYDKLAKKDAKEYARAKMFYGEGAGTRRKLIQNTIKQRRKENKHYNEVFDKYVAEQDMAKHVSAAKTERKVKDTTKFASKIGKKALNYTLMMNDNNKDELYHVNTYNNKLYHFGIPGMRWGVRRYQNQDGSYTSQGRGRYDPRSSSSSRSRRSSSGSSDRRARLKRAAKIGAGVAAAGLAAYGAYRLGKSGKLGGLARGAKSAASRVKNSGVARKVSNSGVGRRVKRGINSAQYHTTRIKNELAYRRATAGKRPTPGVIRISGPTYSKFGRATYGVRTAAKTAASRARGAVGNARRVGGSAVNRLKNPKTRKGTYARNFATGFLGVAGPVYGAMGAQIALNRRRARKNAKQRR